MSFQEKSNIPNIQMHNKEEFSQAIGNSNNKKGTYSNQLISRVKIKVPDDDDFRGPRFSIDSSLLVEPMLLKPYEKKHNFKIRTINVPDYREDNIRINSLTDNTNFFGPHAYELDYYKTKKITPPSKFTRIDLNYYYDKIDMRKR